MSDVIDLEARRARRAADDTEFVTWVRTELARADAELNAWWAHRCAKPPACRHGHPIEDRYMDRSGRWQCRTCLRERNARQRDRDADLYGSRLCRSCGGMFPLDKSGRLHWHRPFNGCTSRDPAPVAQLVAHRAADSPA
jgi:hypothetical protein